MGKIPHSDFAQKQIVCQWHANIHRK